MLEQKEIKSRAITSDKLQQKDTIYNEPSTTAKHYYDAKSFFPASWFVEIKARSLHTT